MSDMFLCPDQVELARLLADEPIAYEDWATLSVTSLRNSAKTAALTYRSNAPASVVGQVTEETRDVAGLRALFLKPETPRSRGVVLFIHGGGWTLYDPNVYHHLGLMLCLFTECTVVIPNYPKAPEAPYPAAIEALSSLYEHLSRRAPVALCGDSAGANLAFSIAARAQTKSVPDPFAVASWYGVFDPEQLGRSHKTFADGFGMTADRLRLLWNYYVPKTLSGAAPLASTATLSFERTFPVRLVTAEADPASSDTDTLAEALLSQGFSVSRSTLQGCCHGAMLYFNRLPTAFDEVQGTGRFLQESLGAASNAP